MERTGTSKPDCRRQDRPVVAAGLCPANDRRRPFGADRRDDAEPVRGRDGCDRASYKPTKAGGGGVLETDVLAGRDPAQSAFRRRHQGPGRLPDLYEPLAGWDNDGNLVPILAAEIPSKENDGLAEDGRSVIWKLKRGVKWHDGMPFTADDVVFNWEYARTPETAAVSIASYKDITVEKIDDFTVRVIFAKPTPFWADALVGNYGVIIPKHLFKDYVGGKSREAPHNLKPVGTGALYVRRFQAGRHAPRQNQSQLPRRQPAAFR